MERESEREAVAAGVVKLTKMLPVSMPTDSLLVSGLKDMQEHESGQNEGKGGDNKVKT